jgi:hypothetical protein
MHSSAKWHRYDSTNGGYTPEVFTLAELDGLFASGQIGTDTFLANAEFIRRFGWHRLNQIRYGDLARPNVNFTPSVEDLLAMRAMCPTTVLSGPNNSGKTLLLKQLFYLIEKGSYLVQCNRFSHVDILNTRQSDTDPFEAHHDQYIQSYYTTQTNTEDNPIKLENVITELTEEKLRQLFEVCGRLLGTKLSLKRRYENRPFSPFYVDIDGENLRYSSSGTRLLITLIGTALDDRVTTLLIDEPELGLSPRIQSALARVFFDVEERKKSFPNLKALYVATHSHLFLDRNTVSNNWRVAKDKKEVALTQVQTVSELHQLQFAMLGNELEALFLPSGIILVEGDSDVTFFSKIVRLHIPDRRVAVVRAGSDGEMPEKINFLQQTFGELDTSPYRDRLFVLLDKRHSVKKAKVQKQRIPPENIVVWTNNGVEYLYPKRIVAAIFRCASSELDAANLESDPITLNGITRTKKELAALVSERLTPADTLTDELSGFLEHVRAVCR